MVIYAKLHYKKEGFTLIELMMVVSIIAILTVCAYPLFTDTKSDYLLYSEARKLVSNLKFLQQFCVDEQKTGQLIFSPDGKNYRIKIKSEAANMRTMTLESDISLDIENSQGLMTNGTEAYLEVMTNGSIDSNSQDVRMILQSAGNKVYINIMSGGKISISWLP